MKSLRNIDIYISFMLMFCLTSCEDQMTADDEFEYLESGFMGMCFWGLYNNGYQEVIIKDEQSYQNFGDSVRIEIYNLDCSTATLPNIDFNKYFLIGKPTDGGGCSATYDRQIIVNEEDKNLIYKIDVDYSGFCAMLITNMNWVLIPYKYFDYSIEFQVE